MARISDIVVLSQFKHHTITKRKVLNFKKEYDNFVEETLTAIDTFLKVNMLARSSAPMVCFHNTDLEQLEVEVGYQICSYISSDDFEVKKVPARLVVETIDLGPYEKQDPTLMELFKFIEDNDCTMLGGVYYYYLNTPDRNECHCLTKMLIPINKNIEIL